MKNFTAFALAPVLALVAFGCSSPTAMQSTEYDDMYYSSSDKTEYISPETTSQSREYKDEYEGSEAVARGQAQSPEYSSSRNDAQRYDDYDDYDEYYDGRDYNPRDNWYRPDYSFVDPYWGSAYTPRNYRYNSAFHDPFYDPFMYDPFFYDPFYSRPGWNNGISINISYNYGWGGWNRPFPYWNRASMYYSRWYPNNPYYHGFYNGYQQGLYSGHNWYYDRPILVGNAIKTQYGPRDARGVVVTDREGGNTSRPVRGEAYKGGINNTDNARVTRPSRSGEVNMQPENGTGAKEVLPARPSRNEYYDPSRRSRAGEQPARIGEEQRREVEPQPRREINRREYTPQERRTRRQEYRTQESNNVRTREYSPQPRQRSVEKPVYERRRETSPPPTPTRSYDRNDNSSSSSSSSSSNDNRRGGRPSRGQ